MVVVEAAVHTKGILTAQIYTFVLAAKGKAELSTRTHERQRLTLF